MTLPSDTLTATITGLAEALLHCDTLDACLESYWCITDEGTSDRLLAEGAQHAATSIRAALEALVNRGADKEAEPIAWRYWDPILQCWHVTLSKLNQPLATWRETPLYASPPTSTAEPVRVRELAWEREYTDHGGYVSVTAKKGLIGVYDVYRLTNESQWHLELAGAGIGLFDTQELAQAAAQEHYSNAIRSALQQPDEGTTR